MKVLFNADDYGLTVGVTDGILLAHTKGVVQSTTLMMNGLATDYAVSQAKILPSLHVGIHLVLSFGKPLHPDVPSLVNDNGDFLYTSSFEQMTPPDPKDVDKEWRMQLDAFLATGLPLHHIDSHHHVHGWDVLTDVMVNIAKDYKVQVRYTESLKDQPSLLLTDVLWLGFYDDGVDADIFNKLKHVEAQSIEVMTHPAIVDDELRQLTSYQDIREKELAILCDLTIPDWVTLM